MDNETEKAPIEGPVLYKFTNQVESSQLDDILAMFYMGCGANSIGIMTAWNVDTSQEELILVGVQLDENQKPDCFPLAKIFSAEDTRKYLAPDGKNGFYDLSDVTEVADAKDNMKPYDQAVVN